MREAVPADKAPLPWVVAAALTGAGAVGSVPLVISAGTSMPVAFGAVPAAYGWAIMLGLRGALIGAALAAADRAARGLPRALRWTLAGCFSALLPSAELLAFWGQWATVSALGVAGFAAGLAVPYGLFGLGVGLAARRPEGLLWRVPLGGGIGLTAGYVGWILSGLAEGPLSRAARGSAVSRLQAIAGALSDHGLAMAFLGTCYGLAIALCLWRVFQLQRCEA